MTKRVLITGGTMGIGLATGLAFGERGARVTLTHRWGSADEDEVRKRFAEVGAPEPQIIQADVSNDDDTGALLEAIRAESERIDVFVSNVSFALLTRCFEDYQRRSLLKSIEYSTWPMVGYTQQIKKLFGTYPRYVVGLSSGGPDNFYANYDFVAMSKAALETMCRYMAYRLFDEGVRVNVVRSRLVFTQSHLDTFGTDFKDLAERFAMKGQFIQEEEVARVLVCLCSGLLDGMNGQVLTVDRGSTFFDNMMRFYQEREHLNLEGEQT